MATPYFTPDQFRALSRVKQTRLGVATGQTNANELLQALLDRAAAFVEIVTGQPASDKDLEPGQPSMSTGPSNVSPAALKTLIAQAIQMRTEQELFQAQNGYIDDASDDVISTLSVGGFSQTKHDPSRRGEQRQLNSWVALGNILWLLMTADRYDYWIVVMGGAAGAGAQMPPSWSYENEIWMPIGGNDYFGMLGQRLPAAAWDGGFIGADPFPFDTTGIDP